MAAVVVSTCYVSAGCNRTPHCVDWGLNDLICYGTNNAIAIYDPNNAAVIHTAAVHTDRVNCVRWIRDTSTENDGKVELISCSSDKTAIIWRYNSTLKYDKLKVIGKLEGHSGVVSATDAVRWRQDAAEDRLIVATASSDSTVKLWIKQLNGNHSDDISMCDQTISLNSHFALDVKLAFNPGTTVPLLIFGGSDMKIYIYVKGENEFEKVISLIGHEDWVRAIDTTIEGDQQALLIATCAQDCLIRVWRIEDAEQLNNNSVNTAETLKLKDISYDVFLQDEKRSSRSFIIKLDAIVAGHENWIYGLHWHPRVNTGDGTVPPLQLLSASMDKTMILWEYDTKLEVWMEKVRVGEVGGNTLGFYGCRISPDGRSIIAHGYQGAFHLWNNHTEMRHWRPGTTVGGHFREVQDVAWDPKGEFIISVSSDQTTRLHAPWIRDDDQQIHWHEMARPQVHGYDMTCIAMLARHKFASGADEKVLRSFEAPRNFLDNFARLCGGDPTEFLDDSAPEGASVPALGLSNKAVFDKNPAADAGPKHPKDVYPESYFVSTALVEPPTEEMLLQNTLWPEVHKLYGHGYEIFCVASNGEGTILASACKASKTDHAYVILWDTKTWSNVAQLHGHSLTVTQMAFSPCGKRLLSVARDRTWSLYGLTWTNDGRLCCEREAHSDKTTGIHSRIIWTCAWSHDSKYFATGSRDGKVVVWGLRVADGNIEKTSCLGNWKATLEPLVLKDSVTALDIAPRLLTSDKRYLFAIGLENGVIHLYKWSSEVSSSQEATWCHCSTLDNIYHHHSTVKRVCFNPKTFFEYSGKDHTQNIVDRIQLASGSCDYAVRVTDISFSA